MLKKIFLFFFLFIITYSFAQMEGIAKYPVAYFTKTEKTSIKLDTLYFKFQADTINKMFNGDFKVWNEKGIQIIDGHYYQNQKKGVWKYYNNDGVLFNTRDFKNTYEFNYITGNVKNIQKYSLDRVDNLISYPIIPDSCYTTSGNYYRFIPNNRENALIFRNNNLLNKIIRYANKNDSKFYLEADFYTPIPKDSILNKLNDNNFKISGYKISEIDFVDLCRINSESRIRGLCPVIQLPNDEYVSFWVFYPQFREELSDVLLNQNKEIITLEDVFHFRYFNSFIYFQEHVIKEEKDIDLSSFLKDIFLEFSINTEVNRAIMEYEEIKRIENK